MSRRLLFHGDELVSGTLDRDEPVITVDIPADALVTGDNALVVEQTSGDGPLYYAFTYKARATHPSEFVALPAEAYAMHDETTWGRSESGTLVVK